MASSAGPSLAPNGRTRTMASVSSLRQMLDVLGQAHPGVFAFFVDRERWCGKAGLREGTNRDGDIFLSIFDRVVNRCAAGRTEVERNPAARVANAYILL